MELFHLLNRGVDKRTIFLDTQDYARFVHDMYEFNNTKPAGDTARTFANRHARDFVSPAVKIVDIHGWCLMKNHYHLLLSERIDGGITKFIRKLNIGYSKYFNERYQRSGTLFQGRTKRIHITENAQFLYILHYLHLNPLDYRVDSRHWRQGKILSSQNTLSYLEKYKWSSYLDYAGKNNFPSILHTSLFADVFKNYKKELSSYIKDMDINNLARITLE